MTFETPEDLLYTGSHEWIDPETGRVGITDYAQDELGDIVFVDLPDEGETVSAGDAFGVIESIKAVGDLYSPVDGEVTAVNDGLEMEPEAVNDDPYGDGWMIEVEFEDGALDGLVDAEEYREDL